MTRPTRYTVQREPFQPSATDAYNNDVDRWGTSQSVDVYGWAPAGADTTPQDSARDAVVRGVDLYAPSDTSSGPKDRWTLDGVAYLQEGHAEDYSHGPSGHEGGLRINLQRVEG